MALLVTLVSVEPVNVSSRAYNDLNIAAMILQEFLLTGSAESSDMGHGGRPRSDCLRSGWRCKPTGGTQANLKVLIYHQLLLGNVNS